MKEVKREIKEINKKDRVVGEAFNKSKVTLNEGEYGPIQEVIEGKNLDYSMFAPDEIIKLVRKRYDVCQCEEDYPQLNEI